VEGAEVGQRGRLLGEQRHPPVVRAPLHRAYGLDLVLEFAGELYQDLDELGDRAAGGADAGHEQHGVPRGLVDLDAVPVHQVFVLERVSVDAGGRDVRRQPTRSSTNSSCYLWGVRTLLDL
jgi:hypothetical protein